MFRGRIGNRKNGVFCAQGQQFIFGDSGILRNAPIVKAHPGENRFKAGGNKIALVSRFCAIHA